MGPNKVVELFVLSRKAFLGGIQSLPVERRQNAKQEMTGAEYKQMMAYQTKLIRTMLSETSIYI